jgi:hypothetical protein
VRDVARTAEYYDVDLARDAGLAWVAFQVCRT